ncbi:hypothetical protein Ahy_A09g043070 [Arachis hypogaea]|uniref:Aminotransferase-like plant mobile domain-containing protein n=1 Tax=Arachis hypogaea TaxID=3818 RepID=A0A445BHG5_ARAHY|nr:hypothetical protein Ahy_A09g043070 [Arachis hypogaea]
MRRRQHGMSLDDRIVLYLQMAGLYHLARLNETKLDEPLLFEDKSGTHLHICWLPYVARLEDMGQYSWGSATLSWLYRFSGFQPDGFDVFYWLLASSLPDVIQVVHTEILEPRHMALWRVAAALIYFTVIEWHQDGHIYWANRVLQFDVVTNLGPLHEYLQWWYQYGRRFLFPKLLLGDPRAAVIPAQVSDVLDNRRVERRCRVRTQSSQLEWKWLEDAIDVMEGRSRG